MLKALIGKLAHIVASACDTAHDLKSHDLKESQCDECEIPQTHCPPRCVGEIRWSTARGGQASASIMVRNVGLAAREFSFSATPLAGPAPGPAALMVVPATATLAPGQNTVVQVSLHDSASLSACQTYRAEVLIQGAWQQAVKVTCHVERDAFATVRVGPSDAIEDRLRHASGTSGVDWRVYRGATAQATIELHNSASTLQTFALETTPLVGPDSARASLTVTPASLRLNPGQSGSAQLELQNSIELSPGQNYSAEIAIRGVRGQRLSVRAHIMADASDHCEVEQGEAPTRKRAHHWYDHFQCVEPCAPSPGP